MSFRFIYDLRVFAFCRRNDSRKAEVRSLNPGVRIQNEINKAWKDPHMRHALGLLGEVRG